MRRFAVMMTQRLLQLLMVLLPIYATHSQKAPQGLQCTNDYVNAVSCVWSGSGEDCWILGVKKIWVKRTSKPMIRSCKIIKRENSPPGCSFVFEDEVFFGSEVLPRISVTCNDMFVVNLTDYKLSRHIKMHRPSAPNVSSSANGTRVWWRLEGPISFMFKSGFKYELQHKRSSKPWEKAETNTVTEQELLLPDLCGLWQLRVRVLPFNRETSQWSDWSPITSWMDNVSKFPPKSNVQGPWRDQAFLIVTGATLSSFVIIFLFLAFCRRKRSVLKVKSVPNPSKYFNTLHSVHKGDLKKWLNPLSLSEAIFTAQLCDLISPVEVCEDWAALPSAASSSARGLLSHQSRRSSGSNASGFGYHSSSLSNYSNMGYFMSTSSGASAGTDPSPPYFTYPEDFRPHSFLASASSYESLRKEPNSPDSGIGFIKESKETNRRQEEECPPFLLFPRHPPPRILTSSVPPALPHPDPATQISSQSLEEEAAETAAKIAAEAAAGGGSAAPLASGSVCRSSSMPVETCRSGYLTLKELQATFSNKSI